MQCLQFSTCEEVFTEFYSEHELLTTADMPVNFLSLPSEARDDVYVQFLALQEPIAHLIHPGLAPNSNRLPRGSFSQI